MGRGPRREVILLDTNAVIFALAGHRRATGPPAGSLYFSPVTLIGMQFLQEVGRGRFTTATRWPPRARIPLDSG